MRELEATPALGFDPAMPQFPTFFAAMGFNTYSYAQTFWNGWQPNVLSIPHGPGVTLTGDAWSLFSFSRRKFFVSFNGDLNGTGCLVVGATSSSMGWEYPAICAATGPDSNSDQGHLVVDDETNRFWAITSTTNSNKARVDVFDACTSSPGYPGCVRTAFRNLAPSANLNLGLQTAIEVNLCTNNAVVVYRDTDDNIRMLFIRPNGTAVNGAGSIIYPANGETWKVGQQNWECQGAPGTIRRCNQGSADCTDGTNVNECLRVEGGPEIDTNTWNGKCYAAVVFDNLVPWTSIPSRRYAKSRFLLVDITNESASPLPILKSYKRDSADNAINNYLSYPILSRWGTAVGWFWTNDSFAGAGNPCKVGVEGQVAANFLAPGWQALGRFAGSYPAVRFGAPGMNDYTIGIKGGAPGDYLFPAWPKSVVSSGGSACPLCNGQRYNKSAQIGRVHP